MLKPTLSPLLTLLSLDFTTERKRQTVQLTPTCQSCTVHIIPVFIFGSQKWVFLLNTCQSGTQWPYAFTHEVDELGIKGIPINDLLGG